MIILKGFGYSNKIITQGYGGGIANPEAEPICLESSVSTGVNLRSFVSKGIELESKSEAQINLRSFIKN